MMGRLYKLDAEHNPVYVGEDLDSINDWAQWHSKIENRRVAETPIDNEGNFVCTVFIGHTSSDAAKPFLFQTLIFGGPRSGEIFHYRTWQEAEAGHAAIVNLCKGEQGNKE
jgi:hypothetical protein